MKKELIKTFKIIFLGLILSAGLGLAFSQPTAGFPNGNTYGPIDVSSNPQSKGGSGTPLPNSLLNINGNLSANALAVFGNTNILGNSSPGSGTLQVGSLNPTSSAASVCTDSAGKLKICGTSSQSQSQ